MLTKPALVSDNFDREFDRNTGEHKHTLTYTSTQHIPHHRRHFTLKDVGKMSPVAYGTI